MVVEILKEIDDYIHTLFIDFENTEEVKAIKKSTKEQLEAKYNTLTGQGMSKEDALLKIKIDFGAKECILHNITENKSVEHYNKFKSIYPRLKNSGIIAIGGVTLFSMVFAGTTELKIEALVTWVVLIILLVFFEMIVEYIDYWYSNRYSYLKPQKTEKQLKKEENKRIKKQNKQKVKSAKTTKKAQNKANKAKTKAACVKQERENK